MIDAYKVYEKLKQTETEFNQILDSETFSFMKDSMIGETKKFQNIFFQTFCTNKLINQDFWVMA